MNDKIEEQIKHIKEEHSTIGIGYHLDLLSTLIQEERKEAVEGFSAHLLSVITMPEYEEAFSYMVWEGLRTYLESEGKK